MKETKILGNLESAQSDTLRRWTAAAKEVEEEFDQGIEYYNSSARADKLFLAFLRIASSFGLFRFGPITIHVATVEEAVQRSVARSVQEGGLDDFVRLSDLIAVELERSGRRRVDELHLLLAFMRFGTGVAHQVFGELAVTPAQVEEFARTGDTQVQGDMERLYSPEEAAEYLKVHVQTVREWIRSGRLKASRLAGQRALRIRATDLISVLEPLDGDAETQSQG